MGRCSVKDKFDKPFEKVYGSNVWGTRASPDRCCNLFGRYAHVPREMVSLQSITLARRIVQAEGATTGANSVDNPGLLAVASCVVRVACVFAMLVSLRCLCLLLVFALCT